MYRRPSLLTDIALLRSGGGTIPEQDVVSDNRFAVGVDEMFAPRSLTPDEITQLRPLLKNALKLSHSPCVFQAEFDAADLLNYAFDLIGDGETVGDVLEQLECLEMEICGPASLREMRGCLATFMGELDGGHGVKNSQLEESDGDENLKRSQSVPVSQGEGEASAPREAFVRRNSLQSQLRKSENHVSVDLSCKKAAVKNAEEMERLFGRGSRRSLKDRMSMMYNDQGELKSLATDLAEEEEDSDGVDCTQDQDSIDLRRREELMDVMNDKSLTTYERTEKMGEVRAKYGLAEMAMKFAQAKTSISSNNKDTGTTPSKKSSIPRAERELQQGRRSSVNLSAKSAAVKKAEELASLFGEGHVSLKDRMAMYNKQGELLAKKKEEQVVEVNDVMKEKSHDESRREDMMEIMKDKSLDREEKTRRMEEIRQIYSASEANEKQPYGFGKKSNLQASGQASEESASRRQSLDDQEREELQSIVGDRSLSKYELKQKMEQVWRKYVQLAQEQAISTSSTMKVNLDLSAKSYANRRRDSLKMLEKSISSNRGAVMSLSERKSMYINDEFIIQ